MVEATSLGAHTRSKPKRDAAHSMAVRVGPQSLDKRGLTCILAADDTFLMFDRALQPLAAAAAGWKVRVAPLVECRPPPPLLPPSPPSLFILCPRAMG